MPQFIGGDIKLIEYLIKNTKYLNGGCGKKRTVYCEFVIEKNGNISKINILRSVTEIYDKEVIRVIKSMPNWKPAKINNQPVRCKMVLPFKFSQK